jgi:hypothetical protein
MMERAVNIYADGRLVYTGSLSLAAQRLSVSPNVLEHLLDVGPTDFRRAQPRFVQSDGVEYPIPRARKYVAQWRD